LVTQKKADRSRVSLLMPFRELLGQATAVDTLVAALSRGRLHHAYRFEGPPGVGKEMAAFGLAQSLLCDQPIAGLACRKCAACHRTTTLTEDRPFVPIHPDLVLVERGLYPPSSLGTHTAETSFIGIEQIRRVVLTRIGFPPHEGKALVFIIRAADELSPSAANALLKTLEEPPERVHFVLITHRPNRLLQTIRSRTLAVRFNALSDQLVREILVRHGLSPDVAPLAQGSASLAIQLADEEASASRQTFIESVQRALVAPDLATAIGELDSRAANRETLREQLGWLAASIAQQAREQVANGPLCERLACQHAHVLAGLTELERNAQPALLLESLLGRLRRA